MGDAVHTAHFAIGSGTKLALEDAIELARQFRDARRHAGARSPAAAAPATRRCAQVDVLRLQNAAWNAMEWFEVVGTRYCDQLPPEQFMYSMLTRSQRISHENLRLRDAAWLEGYERWFARSAPALDGAGRRAAVPPMFTPFTLRGDDAAQPRRRLADGACIRRVDGLPDDFHLVHLGARAMGGAGLLCTEMTCVSPDARISPGCAGLWNDAQGARWQRIVDFVHATRRAKMGMQLGHAGRKGSTQLRLGAAPTSRWPTATGRWCRRRRMPYLAGVAACRAR